MAKKQTIVVRERNEKPPDNLTEHPFYGLRLDDEQRTFRDAIYDCNSKIVFANAKAGSGKTLIAVATASLMIKYGLYEEIVYLTAAGVAEGRQGYLPGDIAQKSFPYRQPLHQALLAINETPERAIKSDYLLNEKTGEAYITCLSNSYIRGYNVGGQDAPVIYIIDEAQNFTVSELRTALTRVNSGSKTIVIGHDGQIDLSNPSLSGFSKYIEHFKPKDWAKVCTLSRNYRGEVSAWADELY